jgi:hypothetical protein
MGIDSGLSSALALCCNEQWTLLDMPIAGDAKRHEINGPLLCKWLREHAPDHAFIEYASARPGQGRDLDVSLRCRLRRHKMALAACGGKRAGRFPANDGVMCHDRRKQKSACSARWLR